MSDDLHIEAAHRAWELHQALSALSQIRKLLNETRLKILIDEFDERTAEALCVNTPWPEETAQTLAGQTTAGSNPGSSPVGEDATTFRKSEV